MAFGKKLEKNMACMGQKVADPCVKVSLVYYLTFFFIT